MIDGLVTKGWVKVSSHDDRPGSNRRSEREKEEVGMQMKVGGGKASDLYCLIEVRTESGRANKSTERALADQKELVKGDLKKKQLFFANTFHYVNLQ